MGYDVNFADEYKPDHTILKEEEEIEYCLIDTDTEWKIIK
jgi:hypothetical protein